MATRRSERSAAQIRQYDSLMLRSTFASLFWSVIVERRRGGFTLQALADALGCGKSAVSRWFSGNPPNWTVDTIARIADALDLDLHVEARERVSGRVHTASGPIHATVNFRRNGHEHTASAEPPATATIGRHQALQVKVNRPTMRLDQIAVIG